MLFQWNAKAGIGGAIAMACSSSSYNEAECTSTLGGGVVQVSFNFHGGDTDNLIISP